jgi:phage terminase large subunit-like protein
MDPRTQFVLDEIVLPTGKRVGESIDGDGWVVDRFLEPVFETNRKGLPRFPLVYLEMARGSWKSGGVAACATAEAVLHPGTDIVIVAADADQARIDLTNLDAYVRANPRLGALFKSRDRGDTRHVEGGSRIRVISADVPGAWGLGGTHARFRVYCEELSEWRDETLWGALASATGKAPDAQIVVCSNAGFAKDRSWQFRVRETARKERWGYLYAPKGTHASWISPEWVAQQRALLPPLVFERVILNRWTAQSGDFVTREQWRACVDPGLRPQPRGGASRHHAGLDLGLTRDRTAFAVVHVDGEHVVLDELLVWEGSRDDPVEIAAVERAVADAHRRFPGLRVLADPWQAEGSVQKLRRVGLRVETFAFSSRSIAGLSRTLYETVSDATLRVFEDEGLEQEILGLQVRETPDGWRFDHRAGGYSDRVVALAMALQAATRARVRSQPLRTYSALVDGSRRRRQRHPHQAARVLPDGRQQVRRGRRWVEVVEPGGAAPEGMRWEKRPHGWALVADHEGNVA